MTRRKTTAQTVAHAAPRPTATHSTPTAAPTGPSTTATHTAPTGPCTTATHDALKADRDAWAALPPKVDWVVGDEVLQLRDCPRCGSTLAKPLDERGTAEASA